MKRALLIFIAAASAANAQTTSITVMADTNRAVRTNFTIGNAQVTGLSALLDAKQATNATLNELSTNNAASLTNLRASNVVGTVATASNITGILAISNGGTGASSASNARTALGLGSAATNPASAFQPASTNLDALALNNGGSLTNLNAQNFLPDYSNNVGKVLSVATGGTNIEWIAISNTVTDGSTITNMPLSNTVGTLSVGRGGTGATNATDARVNLLPAYSNNATKVLAVSSNEADVEWITITNTGGGSTSGVTSVDVSGGTTGLTTSGGPITNSGTITIGGTLSIAAGGTGQTNAAAAIEALLPAYTNNEGKVLGLDTNLALVWTTNAGGGGGGSGTVTSVDASGGSTGMSFTGGPITTNGTLTLGGTLAIGNGGTGAGDVTNARINLLPDYTNNAGKALVLNTNATDITWQSVPSLPVTIAQGGTGATNASNAIINLGILKDFSTVTIISTNAGNQSVVIGRLASAAQQNAVAIGNGASVTTNNGVAIGNSAFTTDGGSVGYVAGSRRGGAVGFQASSLDGGAVGKGAYTENGAAVGIDAFSLNGVALGPDAVADNTNNVQILAGTNAADNTIQFLSAGSVDTNEWSALANSTTFGHYIMAAPTNGTNGQVLAVNSNATGVVWTNVSGVQADLSNVTGTLAVANGGTGATNAAAARVNLLPSYTGNSNYVLTVNGDGTDVVWSAAGSGTIDLASSNATGILPLSKGGVGATNGATALTNLGVYGTALVVLGPGAANVTGGNTIVGAGATADDGSGSGAVSVGRDAVSSNSATAIGYQARALGEFGTAVGYQTTNTTGRGAAIGYRARISGDGFAGGESAVATGTDSVQLGTGTITNASSIQFLSAGAVDTNEWARIAALSTYPTTNISVVGTNNTNTLVFSNGILVEVQ